MPLVDDWIDNPAKAKEIFSDSVGKIEVLTPEETKKKFPDVQIHNSNNVVYFPFRFVNSLPKVNKRGRCFMPKVLANSFASLSDQLIDWEHNLEANGIGGDRIIGHVKATRLERELVPEDFELANKYKEIASTYTPLSCIGLGCLFLRAKGVETAVRNHLRKYEKWSTSMECGHIWSKAALLYEGEFIPIKDAEVAMRECIQPDRVLPYKGRPLAACLGGLDGTVDFWGVGITQSPADTDADVLNMFGGNAHEFASEKTFFMPLISYTKKELEVANSTVDKKLEEIASIEIIGETEPSEDGHKHYILSNLLIVPQNGHSHYLSSYNLKRGSSPTLTGVTDQYYTSTYDRATEVSTGNTHLHLVKIPLKGTYKPDGTIETEAVENLLSEEASVKLEEILKRMETAAVNLSKSADDSERMKLAAEFASIQKELAAMNNQANSEEEKKLFLEAKIKSGEIFTKEMADEAIKNAVEEAEKKHQEELELQRKTSEIQAKRLEQITSLGIDLDSEFEGVMDDDGKTPMTIRKKILSIPVDDDRSFKMDLSLLSLLKPVNQTDPNAATPAAQPANDGQPQTQKTAVGEAANTGKPKIKTVLAGAGPNNNGSETASSGNSIPAVPKHLLGKHALKRQTS